MRMKGNINVAKGDAMKMVIQYGKNNTLMKVRESLHPQCGQILSKFMQIQERIRKINPITQNFRITILKNLKNYSQEY